MSANSCGQYINDLKSWAGGGSKIPLKMSDLLNILLEDAQHLGKRPTYPSKKQLEQIGKATIGLNVI